MVRRENIWKSLDWVTIAIYLILIVFGWFSVCGASYDYGDRDFLDFSTRAGKQFMWIVCSFGLGFVLLMLEDTLYDMFSYIIYIGLILLLIITIFIAPDTKGSRSWLILGPVSLQPAEFAKFATALALAKYMSAYSFTMKNWKNTLMMCGKSCQKRNIVTYSSAVGTDYTSKGNRFCIGVYRFLSDALS